MLFEQWLKTKCIKHITAQVDCESIRLKCKINLQLKGLVFLFNGISTFVGYLMPKPFSLKYSSGTIEPVAGRIRVFISFPRLFARKWT